MERIRTILRTAALVVVPALAFGGLLVPADAARAATPPGLQITTPYPAVNVQPGQVVKFDINVVSAAPDVVKLGVDGAPSGWKTTMRGGGFVIDGITASTDEAKPATATLEVTVPTDAKEGTYPMKVLGNGSTAIPLELRVSNQVAQGVSLTTDFDRLKKKPSETFSYTITINNNVPVEQVFNVEAQGPQGWDVTAASASQAAASTVKVAGGGTGQVTVTAKAPAGTSGGEYPIQVNVTTDAGGSGQLALTAVVAGQAEIALGTSDQRLNLSAQAGKTTRKTLVVTNSGSAALADVALSASTPTDWKVTFEPATLPTVEAGKTAEVTAVIQPSKDAVAGDYDLKVSSKAGDLTSDAQLRVTVKSSRWWGVVAVGVIVVAVGALFGVFRRFGRR